MIRLLQTRLPAALVPVLVSGLVVVWAGACSDPADDRSDRDAAVYAAAIGEVITVHAIPPEDPEAVPVIYVESFDTGAIDLEVQVAVVARFLDRYDIRFIDDLGEVVDPDLENAPVRDDLLLVGLGAITPGATDREVGVRAEVYRSLDDIDAYRMTIVFDRAATTEEPEQWTVEGTPEPVEPEGFVPTS